MIPEDRAEARFLRILLCAAFVMLAFVFAVFLIVSVDVTPTVPQDTTLPPADDQTTPVEDVLASPKYLPVSDDSTQTMDGSRLDAEFGLLMDMNTGKVVASRKGDSRIYPASMTKVMTMIICCERIEDVNAVISVSGDAIAAAYIEGASCAGFVAGERVTVLDLLYGIALPSGADATGTLARYVAGGEAAFAELMNLKAAEMGLKNTHFVNASGLHHDNHYTTPREMAAIVAYAMDNELCRTILSATTYTSTPTSEHPSGVVMYSTGFSRMSATKFGTAQIVATKTGFTDEARFCFASYAETDSGGRYVLITANGNDRYAPVYDCKYVYETFAK